MRWGEDGNCSKAADPEVPKPSAPWATQTQELGINYQLTPTAPDPAFTDQPGNEVAMDLFLDPRTPDHGDIN